MNLIKPDNNTFYHNYFLNCSVIWKHKFANDYKEGSSYQDIVVLNIDKMDIIDLSNIVKQRIKEGSGILQSNIMNYWEYDIIEIYFDDIKFIK